MKKSEGTHTAFAGIRSPGPDTCWASCADCSMYDFTLALLDSARRGIMGSCNATERRQRPHVDASSGYKPSTPDQGSGEGVPPISPLGIRSDGAIQNRPTHEGAILGIVRYEVQHRNMKYRRCHTCRSILAWVWTFHQLANLCCHICQYVLSVKGLEAEPVASSPSREACFGGVDHYEACLFWRWPDILIAGVERHSTALLERHALRRTRNREATNTPHLANENSI